ncbi:hypothetical protein [Roseibium sp. RKSG952]|uniref:hypothetical protein n=1 Tax=Roseibium sp. RKSG952 TaxID=2529384 RepID=UPI0012BD5FB1|nr:hypothetical protein [Roseibium sp. RKSG952]MTH94686.1 hypothetical protein [Roseibium sp. RKSG952]
MRHDFKSVSVPPALSGCPKDKRGYPIPFSVAIDRNGKPDFKVVDRNAAEECIKRKLCALSGKRFEHLTSENGGYWFIGGPKSAFDQYGAYLDLPVRAECGRYALRVCPFLAIPGMAMHGNLEKSQARMDDNYVVQQNDTVIPDQPDIFVFVQATKYEIIQTENGVLYKPHAPYRRVEFWKDGSQIDFQQARELSNDVPQTDEELKRWCKKLPKQTRTTPTRRVSVP